MENEKRKSAGYRSASYLAKIAMLAALATGLLLIEFPIFPAAPWLELNVSDLPALIASFMFGPLSGVVVNGVKNALWLLIHGTSTGFVGELSNLVSGSLYALVAGIVYKLKKDKLGAVLALVLSGAVFTVSMQLFNRFALLPLYGMTAEELMRPALLWTLLFNVIKTCVTGALTFFLYKSTHRLLNRF